MDLNKWVLHAIRCGLGAVFVIAGVGKLLDPAAFAQAINDFGVVYPPLAFPTALSILTLELLGGAGLCLNVKGSLGLVSGLLLLFIAVLAYGLWIGLDIDCGCFGPDLSEWMGKGMSAALWRDMAMLLCCAYLFYFSRRHSPARSNVDDQDR